jgi:hypothetical protein
LKPAAAAVPVIVLYVLLAAVVELLIAVKIAFDARAFTSRTHRMLWAAVG